MQNCCTNDADHINTCIIQLLGHSISIWHALSRILGNVIEIGKRRGRG